MNQRVAKSFGEGYLARFKGIGSRWGGKQLWEIVAVRVDVVCLCVCVEKEARCTDHPGLLDQNNHLKLIRCLSDSLLYGAQSTA